MTTYFPPFFADDIILTSKITTKSCHAIIDNLNNFNSPSGQSINFTKSKIFFSRNCTTPDKQFMLHSFSMTEDRHFGRYLGFPIFQPRPTKNNF